MVELDLETGGRLARVVAAGHELLTDVDRSTLYHWGSYVMAPWAGRIRDGRFQLNGQRHQLPVNWPPHAIHGTVADRPWQVVSASPASAILQCALDERWPWRGTVRQAIDVAADAISFRIEVHADDEPFPAATGWHPWFRRVLTAGDPVRIELDAGSMLVRDQAGIPTGERVPVPAEPWDDCFDEIRWPIRLVWPGALDLAVDADTRYAVVYTEPRDAVCVEPQSGPPDAPNVEPRLVTPDEPLVTTMTWTWSTPA